MTTGRTAERWLRVYVDGYDMSGQARKIGPLSLRYKEAELTALSDSVMGYLPDHAEVNAGTLNAVFDNTAVTGIHNLFATAGVKRTLAAVYGIQGAPAQGDPVFAGQFTQGEYKTVNAGGGVTVSLPFTGWAIDSSSEIYATPWGVTLNANAARTAANTAIGVDLVNVTTLHGGYLTYQVTASSGAGHTATIKVQHADTNLDGSFADITGATTGVIVVTAGVNGLVAVANTLTIKQFTRWQIVLGTATSVTFLLTWHSA